MNIRALITGLILSCLFQSLAAQTVDDLWAEVSRTVKEGDFEGYAALYHEDAVLVNEITADIYPISQALEGWKAGFETTRSGDSEAKVEFRFSERIHGERTAHDAGIFKYSFRNEGESWSNSYVRFRALLLKKNGKWMMLMEYQQEAVGREKWDALGE